MSTPFKLIVIKFEFFFKDSVRFCLRCFGGLRMTFPVSFSFLFFFCNRIISPNIGRFSRFFYGCQGFFALEYGSVISPVITDDATGNVATL